MEQQKGLIRAICISPERGTAKKEVSEAVFIKDFGIRDDAHAGKWHRQVSLLSGEKIEGFREKGADVSYGDFGENIVTEGIDFTELPIGSILTIGSGNEKTELKVTQKGKECHSHCSIFEKMGECIMPVFGIFAEVTKGGIVKRGDPMTVQLPDKERPFQAAVIILSDRAFSGEREDESGPLACKILKDAGYEVIETILLPDDPQKLKKELIRLSDTRQPDLIITSGGTGFSPRDNTPEATMEVAHKNAPGIAEYIRMRSFEVTDRAMLSRGVSVIRNSTLIVNLPGSPKAVREDLGFILKGLEHGIAVLRQNASE